MIWYHGTDNPETIIDTGFDINKTRMGVLGKAVYLGQKVEAECYGTVLLVYVEDDEEKSLIIDARTETNKLQVISYSSPQTNIDKGIRYAILKNRPNGNPDMIAIYDTSVISKIEINGPPAI